MEASTPQLGSDLTLTWTRRKFRTESRRFVSFDASTKPDMPISWGISEKGGGKTLRTIGPAGTFLILLGVLAAVPVQAQTPPGICDRTQQVQDGILNWLSGVSDCAEVTTTHLTTVTELTLERVGLTSLRADDFAGLTELKELRLTSNKQLLALPSGVFSDLAKLETLDLYNNQFYQGLPAGVFSGLSALETLNLGANRIPALRAEAFSGLSALETLNLGNNRITALPAGVFSGLSALETLNLGGNDLTEVPVEVFSDISALKMLILRWNQIGSVPDAAFSDLPNLEKLDLFSNLITALPSGAFSGLTKLKVLKAGSNQLVGLPDGVFSGLTMLDTLDVAENPVHPLLLTVTVEMAGSDRVRAKVPAGAPFALSLPVSVTNGGLAGGASTLEITAGAVAGEAVAVTRTEGTTEAVTVDLGTPLPSPPMGTQPPYRHRGYAFVRAPSGLPVKFVSLLPRVTSVVVASAPQSGDTYRSYETILFTVTFSEPVRVTPGRLRLKVGLDNPGGASGSTVEAVFSGLSQSQRPTADTPQAQVARHLHFEYKVQLFDRAEDGVRIGANALRLASGARIQGELGADAELDHVALGPQSDHKVDGRADVPMIERIEVVSTPRLSSKGTTNRDTYGEGENIRIEVTFDQPVYVEGEPTFALEVGNPCRAVCEADYASGSGTNTLVFAYLVLEVDVDRNGIAIPANPIEVVYGDGIRNAADQEAHLSYKGKGTQRGHKVDGSRAAGSHLSVEDAEAHEADGEMEFTVRLEPHGLGIVRVNYATAGRTATAGEDYRETRGRLTFNSLETERTVSVPITDDDEEDDGETFTLVLSNASGATIADAEATGTIRNSETTLAAELTAEFRDMPETHDGESGFRFRVAFSEDIGISFRALREDAFTVTGGRVTRGTRVDDRRDLFEMTVEPDSGGDVTITLPAGRECGVSGAICTKGENRQQLTNSPSATVAGPAGGSGPPELTAEFEGMPAEHRGEGGFHFRVAFSEDIGISFRALRQDAFTVTGGRVTGGSRVDGRRDLFKMTVRPDSDGDVTITLAAGRECATSGAICTKGENRRQLTNSPSATVKGPAASSAAAAPGWPDRAARLCSALAAGDGLTPSSAAAALWGDGDPGKDRLDALDSLGNGNGGYDLGDMLAWAARCRGGEASGPAAGSGPPSPPPALPASGPAGGASRRRKGARGPARHRRTVPDPPATGSATRRSGWLRTALLAVVISVWGCGDGIVDPRNDAPRYDGANAAVVDPGPLHVRLTAPPQARDIGAMLVIEGPAIDSLQAPGLEMFETEESSSTRREVVIAGALPDAPVLRVWVPHRGDEARYRVRLLQVAAEDFALRDLSVYGSVISR